MAYEDLALRPVELARRDLEEWTALGFTEGDTYIWIGAGFRTAEEAQAWRGANYAPWQARFLADVLAYETYLGNTATDGLVDSAVHWRAEGPPAWWACLCVAAGVLTAREALGQYSSRESDPALVGDLARQARLRGLNPWRLTPCGRPGRDRWGIKDWWRKSWWR